MWPSGKPMLEQAPGRACGPVERGAHTWAGLLVVLVNPLGIHTGAVCSSETAPPGRYPCWSSSWRSAAHGKDSHWSNLWRTVSHGRDPTLQLGKSVRSPSPKDEEVAETTCDELTTTHISCSPVLLAGRKQRKSGVKLSLERRKGWGKVF